MEDLKHQFNPTEAEHSDDLIATLEKQHKRQNVMSDVAHFLKENCDQLQVEFENDDALLRKCQLYVNGLRDALYIEDTEYLVHVAVPLQQFILKHQKAEKDIAQINHFIAKAVKQLSEGLDITMPDLSAIETLGVYPPNDKYHEIIGKLNRSDFYDKLKAHFDDVTLGKVTKERGELLLRTIYEEEGTQGIETFVRWAVHPSSGILPQSDRVKPFPFELRRIILSVTNNIQNELDDAYHHKLSTSEPSEESHRSIMDHIVMAKMGSHVKMHTGRQEIDEWNVTSAACKIIQHYVDKPTVQLNASSTQPNVALPSEMIRK